MNCSDYNVTECEKAYSAMLDFSDAFENEKLDLLMTPEFDSRRTENIAEAVFEVLNDETLAVRMNLSDERKDLQNAIRDADFDAMGDAIRCISYEYWNAKAEKQARENFETSFRDEDCRDFGY